MKIRSRSLQGAVWGGAGSWAHVLLRPSAPSLAYSGCYLCIQCSLGDFLQKGISVLLIINIVDISQAEYQRPATCSHKTMALGGHVGMGCASAESQAGAKSWGRWAVVVYRCLMMMLPFRSHGPPPQTYSVRAFSAGESPRRRSWSWGAHGINRTPAAHPWFRMELTSCWQTLPPFSKDRGLGKLNNFLSSSCFISFLLWSRLFLETTPNPFSSREPRL